MGFRRRVFEGWTEQRAARLPKVSPAAGCSREGARVFLQCCVDPRDERWMSARFDGLKGDVACVGFTLCRTGEFRVSVTVFNLVSWASLSSHVFVVTRPCQPPAVKNMGPSELQVENTCHMGFRPQSKSSY